MDWIVIGIFVAIGFYVAPMIIGLVVISVAIVVNGIVDFLKWITRTEQ